MSTASAGLHPKIAKFYNDVPAEAVDRLLDFRQRFPYRKIEIGGQHAIALSHQEAYFHAIDSHLAR
jgi:hypothetical protein